MSPLSNRLTILAGQVREAQQGARTHAEAAADRILEAGHMLIEAKGLVKHGGWLAWLREAGVGERTAQGYMRLARAGLKSAMVADLGLKAALISTRKLQRHSLNECLPSMTEDELASLANSIACSGLIMPIILFEGKILDGWQRYLACRAAGVEPHFKSFEGTWPDAAKAVYDYNCLRTHLESDQKYLIKKAFQQAGSKKDS